MVSKMKRICNCAILLMLLGYILIGVKTECISNVKRNECKNNKLNFYNFVKTNKNQLLKAASKCETLIIFDLSQKFTSDAIFDLSIKNFLSYILKSCNTFKYVIIDDDFDTECIQGQNGCNLKINECNNCDIVGMDYNEMTSSYSNEYFNDSGNYFKFLNGSLFEFCPCKDNTVVLLTNRIVTMKSVESLNEVIENSCIKFTIILLGQGNKNAGEALEIAYNNSQVQTLNFPNYDCLNYLYYCLLPCSVDTPKCLQSDIDDCIKVSTFTPNGFPDQTLHIWIVLAFNQPFSNDNFNRILRSLQNGISDYMTENGIKRVRIKVVTSDSWIIPSYEDVDSLLNLSFYYIRGTGDVIDDQNEINERLNLIPWSDTLTHTRPGILSNIILANYASESLITLKKNQSLQGWMYVYNAVAYTYYASILKNDTNFYFSSANFTDPISLPTITTASAPEVTTAAPDPIDTITSTSIKFTTTTVITTSTTTTAESHPSSAAFGITYFVMNTYALLFVVCYYAFLVT